MPTSLSEAAQDAAIATEAALLGTVLFDNSVWPKTEQLSVHDFGLHSHRLIFARMAAMFEDGRPVDVITLREELARAGQFESVGGEAYLSKILDHALPESFDGYVCSVLRSSRERQFARLSEQLSLANSPEERASLLSKMQDTLQQDTSEKRIRFEDIPNLQTLELPPVDYLVPGIIARHTLTLWTGTDGTAKSFLALFMSIAVATAGSFLGRRCQKSPVLYLDYENPGFAIKDRLALMADSPMENLKIWGTWCEQQPPQIGSEVLLSMAKECKPLIIVDPFRYSHTAEENDSGEMMAIMKHLRACAIAGAAVVILHHPAKTEGSTGRGSSAIKGACDVALLQKLDDESGLITLRFDKNRFGQKPAINIRPDFELGTFELTDSPQFRQRNDDIAKLQGLIAERPGCMRSELPTLAHIRRETVFGILKEGNGTLWRSEKMGRSLAFYPLQPEHLEASHGK